MLGIDNLRTEKVKKDKKDKFNELDSFATMEASHQTPANRGPDSTIIDKVSL